MQEEQRVPEHQAQEMVEGDLIALVNSLTEGLRELPTDYATRVKHFLAEYLGSLRHPVPFGGRAKDFAHLDAWLADQDAPPYLLLAAPAGRGKSALLLRWCQRLLARPDSAVVYFPVSIRFRTNLAGVVFPALVALLANLHGEKLPADPNMHEEVWRGLLVDYMTRPLPGGRPLVLVLDGVDEAADWVAGSGLFPPHPPRGLRVVLSARYLANDRDVNAWLQRLGWTRQGLAHTLQLYPLDRAGIASVLIQMGFPLDLLGARVNIVSELHRLSEGDPLLVRLYVDDLWERGEAAVVLKPEDLRAIRPGLAGYFERWWKDQRLLWSKASPQREAAAQTLLNLLAGALGPLSKEDILSLAPEQAGFGTGLLEQHLSSLSRFVIGDGMHQGYVFSHPRLGNYFLEERLSEAERQEVERRFLAWGEKTLEALNAGRLLPEKASAYIVQYYGAHLERVQANARALLSLVSDGWRRAWEKLDRANAGFLGDVERAWRAAEREDTAATSAGQQAPYLGEEIRCLLCRVSVNSMTSNISPRLMLEAVKTGVWTPAQGLACIRLIADLAPRARELVGLAPFVQEPLRTEIFQEALDTVATIKDEYDRLDILVELAPGLPEELLWQILEVVPAIQDEADRAGVLAELAPALSHSRAQLARALDLAQEIEEDEYRAMALAGLAPYLSQDQHGRVLQLVQLIREERDRAQALTALLPHLSETFLRDALQEARSMQDGLSQVRLLTELLTYLPDRLKTEVMQEVLELVRDIDDREYRVEVLVKLAPFLPAERLHQVLQEIQLLWDESYRARALTDLIPFIPGEQLPAFQQAVQVMKSEQYRTAVLLQLLPRLPEALLEQALDIVQATWDEGLRAEILAKLAPSVSEASLPALQEMIQVIKDRGYRVWLLAELEAPLAGKLEGSQFNMLATFMAIEKQEERLQTLVAIVPRLSEEALTKIFALLLPEVFGSMWLKREDHRADILAKLGSRLPEAWLSRAMEMVQAMGDEAHQVRALVALAPRIRETLLSEVLDIVRAMKDREKRAQVLEVLVSSLSEERKGERVQEMLQVLQVIKDEPVRGHMVVKYASYLPEKLPSERTQMVIKAVQAIRYETNQARVLEALVSHMPEDMFEEVLGMVQGMRLEETRVPMLEALASHVPERFFSPFLSAALEIRSERWRAQVLATMVAYAPERLFAGMLGIVQGMQEESARVNILVALAPHTPEESFSQLWAAIWAIKDEGRRVWVLGALALRVPDAFFPQLWDAIQAVRDQGWQMRILGTLAPYMSERQFSQLWVAAQAIRDEAQRARMLGTLARHAPEHFFSQLWEAALRIEAEGWRVQVLEAIAPRVPEDFFSQLWEAAREMQSQASRAKILEALAYRVPERFFSQFLQAVQSMPAETHQAKILETLAPRVPERFFPHFWEAVRAIENEEQQMRVLKALIPHVSQEKLADVLELLQALPYEERRIELLEALVPYLSEEKCAELLETLFPLQPVLAEVLVAMQETWSTRWYVKTLAVLVPHLPEDRLLAIWPAALKAFRVMRPEEDRIWALSKLASNVPQAMLQEMLEAIWSIGLQQHQAQVLAVLLPSLSEAAWATALELTVVKVRDTGNTTFLLQMLKAAGSLVKHSSPALLYPALHEILHLLAPRTRLDTLTDLALLAPAIRALGSEDAVTQACCATLEVGYWWP
jgi:uncharacterized protein YeeX (DUF496 family)